MAIFNSYVSLPEGSTACQSEPSDGAEDCILGMMAIRFFYLVIQGASYRPDSWSFPRPKWGLPGLGISINHV